MAAEDDTSGVGRRGTSGRGRKPPPAKKETNSTNSNNKKNSEPVYNSSDESSEVFYSVKINFLFKVEDSLVKFENFLFKFEDFLINYKIIALQEDWSKPRGGKRRKKALSDSD